MLHQRYWGWEIILFLWSRSNTKVSLWGICIVSQLAYDSLSPYYFNTPANDTWTLNVFQISNTQPIRLTFSVSTGQIDTTLTSTGDLSQAAALLPASFSANNITTFWSTINWLYVSLYWTVLYDFRQTTPFYYPQLSHPGADLFSYAQELPSTNNIFTNPGIFDTYNTFLRTLPNIASLGLDDFAPLTSTPNNILQPKENVTFLINYDCQELVQKSAASIVQAVLVGTFVFVQALYGGIALALGWYYKQRDQGLCGLLRS
jgi:hypothetical protein